MKVGKRRSGNRYPKQVKNCQPCVSKTQGTKLDSTNHTSLQALTSAALVLPGLLLQPVQAKDVAADSSFNFHYSRFQEGKRKLFSVPNKLDPIKADVIHASGALSLTDRVKFSFNYSRDVWSGATPVSTAPLLANSNKPILENTSSGVVTAGASPIANSTVTLDRQLNPVIFDQKIQQITRTDTRSVHILSSASPETRNAANFNLGYEWDNAALSIGGGLSLENDFKSRFGNVNGRFDFNQKLTSVKYGLGYSNSNISAILDHDIVPYLTKTAYENQIEKRGGSEILQGNRQDWTANLGLTQILGKQSLIDVNIGYTHSSGFLENPYKATTVIFLDPDELNSDQEILSGDLRALIEQRPGNRNQVAFSNKYIQHISKLDAALHVDYKFSFDDWGINTNTFTLDWVQPLGNGWTLTPRIRYYSQSEANFYEPFLFSEQTFTRAALDQSGREIFIDPNNPDKELYRDNQFNLIDSAGNIIDDPMGNVQQKRLPFDAKKLPKNFSSDHRLSGFGSLSGGVTINKQFIKGIELEAGFEYYTRASALKMGGGGGNSFADYDYYVASAAIKINIEKLNFNSNSSRDKSTDSDHEHSKHPSSSQHGGHVPAGVMSGHMLDKAGDFMVGYRFMYGRMGGDILHGTHSASDQEIVTAGCSDTAQCRFAPTFMNMKMHMLNVMFAPTSWLNLMLMPKFVDMEMDLRELSGRPPSVPGVHEHTGISGHTTGGVGDTIMTSLIKLYQVPGHRLHMGLGFSAPTGNVGVKFRRVFQIDGGLVHFGMQLGSGTWDFLPSLTYTGESNRWSWGAQLSGVKRLEAQNKSGYRLGDKFQATAWSSYNLTRWLSASIRGIYTVQGEIHGDFNGFNGRSGPQDFPRNQGGQYWDIGIGVSATVPKGKFVGNTLSFEWLQPIQTDVNGYQLDRKGALAASWGYHF